VSRCWQNSILQARLHEQRLQELQREFLLQLCLLLDGLAPGLTVHDLYQLSLLVLHPHEGQGRNENPNCYALVDFRLDCLVLLLSEVVCRPLKLYDFIQTDVRLHCA